MVSQTIAATPPLLSVKVAYRRPKTGPTRGASQKQLASEAYRATGGVARNSIAQSRYSVTLRMCPDQNLGKSGRAKEDLQPMGPPRKLLQYHWGRNYYIFYLCRRFSATDSNSEEFQKPQPLLVSEKVLQYTSNLYSSTPPIHLYLCAFLAS